jgi:hypothetical protein
LILNEGTVLIGGAEINIDVPNLFSVEGEELRVPEFLAVVEDTFVSNERFVALLENSLNDARPDVLAVEPASFEIGSLINFVVIWARESEIIGKQLFDNFAIFRFERSETGTDVRLTFGGHLEISFPFHGGRAGLRMGHTPELVV